MTRRAQIEKLRDEVKSRADLMENDRPGSGWMEIRVGRSTLRIPRAPFEVWALRPFGANGRIPPAWLEFKWLPISPIGLKMYGMEDDPCHTDWMLGAGLDIDTYDQIYFRTDDLKPVGIAIHEEAERIRQDFGASETVVSGCGVVTGTIVHPAPDEIVPPGAIVVIPSLRPTYFSTILAAIAVIGV